MKCEKVMRRQRENLLSGVCQSDQPTQAFPQPLCRGSVDCELIHEVGTPTVKVMGMYDQITVHRVMIMGIKQHPAHCYTYLAALQGRGIMQEPKHPKTQSSASHQFQMNSSEVGMYQRHKTR